MLVAGLPAVVFVTVNALAALRPAIIAAVATGVALTIYRLVRKQSVQQAISGLFGVLVAALIAARTGQARGYFLFGIWQSFVYAVPFVISVLVRRPLVGVVYEFVDPTPGDGGRPLVPPPAAARRVHDRDGHRRRAVPGARLRPARAVRRERDRLAGLRAARDGLPAVHRRRRRRAGG